jgi:hypothetical protein
MELFGSPLNCSMSSGISYYSAFPEDEFFGATTDSFRYRWTGSCISNPEYEPEDMLKAVLHAFPSSEAQDAPFLVVLILPVWEDTSWNSAAIRGHHNMSTLIRIPAGHTLFVPAHKQSDKANPVLSPAIWPVELVLIANEKGRETFVCHDRIQQILSLAIQTTCFLTAAHTLFFPTPPSGGRFGGRLTPLHRRLFPTSPAIPAQKSPLGPATPPCGLLAGGPTLEIPT